MHTEQATPTKTETLAATAMRAARTYGGTALRHHRDGRWVEIAYPELGPIVREIARGLAALGVQPGERVAILSNTRAEWTLADLGAICAGAVVTPIYQTNSPSECRYVLEHSGAKVVFCEDAEQVAKVRQVRSDLPELKHVVAFETAAAAADMSLDDLRARAGEVGEDELDRRIAGIEPDDPCTIIYTSGTTGPPKGCVLTHRNFDVACDEVRQVLALRESHVFYAFLPLAHVLTRIVQMVAIRVGAELAYWRGDATKIVEDVGETNPTHLPAVPRIFEKIHTTATAKADEAGGIKARLFHWAVGRGRAARRAEREGRSPGFLLQRQHALADKLVLSKVRSLFGSRLEVALTGAAPIDPEILEFFDAAGVTILEGYGMTETTAVATLNTPDAQRFGTVGRPLPACEVRIADDGELLMRGPNIFGGYYRNDEATRETLVDGWLHSGDVAEVDSDGFVRITGRKKELIVTSSGKNVAPANIENSLRQSRWISQAVVIGDRRPYLVALVTLDEAELDALRSKVGAPADADAAALARHDAVREEIRQIVARVNREYARIEQVKRFDVLERELSQPEGELTPTLKVKRNVVHERYADRVDALYDGSAGTEV